MIWIALLLAQAAVPTQIERGEALFYESSGGCATCHAVKGKGTAIGPDLKGVARLTPAGLSMAIRSTVTQYVQTVKLKSAGSFPTVPPPADSKATTVEIYDLSKMPPELHKLERSELGGMTPNSSWKHPPSAHKYTDEQLADIIAFVKFAGTGSRAAVDPSEVK